MVDDDLPFVMTAEIPDETAEVLEAACRRGFELLDEKQPEWWREVDRSKLDMGDPFNCTLGQLRDKHKGSVLPDVGFDPRYGFELPDELPHEPVRGDRSFKKFNEELSRFNHECYKFLDICWSNEIGARLAAEDEEQDVIDRIVDASGGSNYGKPV